MITQLNWSPGTSTPCQNDEVANSTRWAWRGTLPAARCAGRCPAAACRELDFERHAIVDQAHLLIAGEEHERAAAAQLSSSMISSPRPLVKAGSRGSGRCLRDVEQRLLRCNRNGWGRPACARCGRPRRCFRKFEPAGDGERRRGQNHGIDRVEEAFVEHCGNVDGRGLQETCRGRGARSSRRTSRVIRFHP